MTVLGRTESRLEPWDAGLPVLRALTVDASHDLVAFKVVAAEAAWAGGDRAYWQAGPAVADGGSP